VGRNWTLLKKFRYVTTVKEFMIKKFLVTMFLGALVPGVGHIYLSVHHPGIMIFLIGLFLRFVTDTDNNNLVNVRNQMDMNSQTFSDTR